jgi:non-specific serine/threonine protein kinase
MATFHLRLLGTFELRDGDTPVLTVNTTRLQALLAYLVIHRDAPQSRQRLAYLFWSDSTESQARTNLRNLIHLLRQALPPFDALVHAEPQTLQWRADADFICDVVEFERALASNELERAIELYAGGFLPDSYDDWALAVRERLRQQFLRALENLIARQQTQGDMRAAIRTAELLLEQEPVQEEIWRELMTLHARVGDRIGLRRVYDACAEVLQRELGEAPSALTRELYEKLSRAESPPHKNNLPTLLTSFVGRAREMAQVQELLAHSRLVTLIGAGGCGKTRLALQTAHQLAENFPDGVCWVDLAALNDATLVARTTLSALGLSEQSNRPPETTLVEHLRAQRILLVFDNCEHLVSVVARLIANLLAACPDLKILATSREALRVAGETTWVVPSLAQTESQKLFVERATMALPNFALIANDETIIARICQRLDGIPLAIELAAARVPILSLAQIAARLDDCFNLLASDHRAALPRHQTLRATMEWSYALLAPAEQNLLRCLSVFAASFTLDAVEAIYQADALDALASLVSKSLVEIFEHGDPVRFRLLELVRQYAQEKLREQNHADEARDRHLDFYLQRAETIEPELRGTHQAAWFDWLEKEHDNFRVALTWSEQSAERAEKGLRLASALWWFWRARGYLHEGHARLTRLLALTENRACVAARVKALNAAGFLALFLCDYTRACALCERALMIATELNNQREMALALFVLGDPNVRVLNAFDRDWRAESLALWRAVGDAWSIALVLNSLGEDARREKNYASARTFYEESLAIRQSLGDQRGIAVASENLGYVALHQNDLARARELFANALTLKRDLGIGLTATEALTGLAGIAATQNDSQEWRRAARILGAVAQLLATVCPPMMDEDRIESAHIVASLRARIGADDFDEQSFERAWAEGRALTLTQVIEYALDA